MNVHFSGGIYVGKVDESLQHTTEYQRAYGRLNSEMHDLAQTLARQSSQGQPVAAFPANYIEENDQGTFRHFLVATQDDAKAGQATVKLSQEAESPFNEHIRSQHITDPALRNLLQGAADKIKQVKAEIEKQVYQKAIAGETDLPPEVLDQLS